MVSNVSCNMLLGAFLSLQMSLTFQQIILDARKLVIRITDHETTADKLISEIESVCSQIDSMKQVTKITVILILC